MKVQNLFYGVLYRAPHAIPYGEKINNGKENCKKDRQKSGGEEAGGEKNQENHRQKDRLQAGGGGVSGETEKAR